MMKTAKIKTGTFTIQCPNCLALQTERPTEAPEALAGPEEAAAPRLFTAAEVEPAQVMTCTSGACKKLFRLPTKLQADAE